MHSVTVAYIFRFRTFRCVSNTNRVIQPQVIADYSLFVYRGMQTSIVLSSILTTVEHPEQQHSA